MKKNHQIDMLFVLLLYGMFTLLSLLMILIGTSVYKRSVSESDIRSNTRASLSYVANKIRAGDAAGMISLEKREGIELLVIREGSFETLIYYYDGTLREDFSSAELNALREEWKPEQGEKLVSVSSFSIKEEGGLFTLCSTDANGTESTLQVFLRT